MKKNILILLFLVIIMISPIINAANLLEQGINFYNQSKYQEAIEKLNSFAINNPKNSSVYYYLGLSHLKIKEYSLALNSLKLAKDINPDNYKIILNLSRAYYHLVKYEKAKSHLEKLNIKTDEQIYNLLGLIYMQKDSFQKAEENFKIAMNLNNSNYYVLNNLSYLYIKNGDYKSAKKYLIKAVNLEPEVAFIYNNLGIVYENLNEYDLALEYYKKALEINVDYIKAKNNLKRLKGEK